MKIMVDSIRGYDKTWNTIKSPQSKDNAKKMRRCIKCGKEWITKNRFQFRCYKCHEYEAEYESIRNEGWLHHV